MNVHDNPHIASNYDNYIELLLGKQNLTNFVEFHLTLAEEYGGNGVLDIACGTGAITVPLIEAGYDVCGFDLSPAMVNVAKTKTQADCFSVANMLDFSYDRKFSLTIIARSGFMHLLKPEEQRKTLRNIHSHLTDGGVLTLNTFQPHPIMQAEQMKTPENEYFLRTEYINKDGNKERIYNEIHYDFLTQIMTGNWRTETLDTDGNTIHTEVAPHAMRQTYRWEMEYLFELCGFELLDVYGDYNYSTNLGYIVWVVKKIA
jgi:SAM-dependent methyltransferase